MLNESLLSLQSRELEIAIYWRDWRQMAAIKFLRLEDFLDNQRHGMAIHLEPQGILFAEVGVHDNQSHYHSSGTTRNYNFLFRFVTV